MADEVERGQSRQRILEQAVAYMVIHHGWPVKESSQDYDIPELGILECIPDLLRQ
jgi:hypothetical protein